MLQPLQHLSQVSHMLGKGLTHNYDVMDVHKAAASNQTMENTFHKSLKSRRGISQPKWHDLEHVVSIMGHKCSLFLGCGLRYTCQ